MKEPLYRIALFDGPKDDQPKPVEVTWVELVTELSSFHVTECREGQCLGHQCPYKKIEAWSPVDYPEESKRADTAVKAVTLAVFDLDSPEESTMVDLAGALNGLLYVCHGTHSLGSYRLILPIVAPVEPRDWPRVWQTIRIHYKIPADPTCANLSRIYFFPSKPWGRGDGEVYEGQGAPLDVAWLLGLYEVAPTPLPPAPSKSAAPVAAEIPTTTDITEIRKALKNLRRAESADLARKILSVEALAKTGARDATVNRAASLLATAPENPPSPDLAVEILKPSISLMECEPEGLQHWLDKARSSFIRALDRRVANDSRSERLNAALRKGLSRSGKDPESESENKPDDPDREDEPWQADFLTTENDDGDTVLRQCGANANLILTHDEAWKNFLVFNEVTKDIDITGGPLTTAPHASLDVEVANWLSRSEYQLILKPRDVGEQILAVARRHPINPLKDYLKESRGKWIADRTERIEDFFATYFGAHGDSIYLKAIGKRFLISCVARAMQPGCFVKTVVILEGPQGAYKSSSLRVLGGEFFSDTKIDIGTKDGRMAASRFWIIELSELASMRRVDVETLKGFISSPKDDIRLPFGKVIEAFPRCSVLVGTTNSDDYLQDPTGNTRYWPVQVGKIDLEGLRRDRDLIWGEAVVAWEEGEKWWFEPEEVDVLQLAEQEAKQRTKQGPRTEQILEWFLIMPPDRRPETVSVNDLASRALQVPPDRVTEGLLRDIGVAMSQLGFKKVRRRVDTIPVWRYEIPSYMRSLPQEAKPKAAHLQITTRIITNQTAVGRRNIQLPQLEK